MSETADPSSANSPAAGLCLDTTPDAPASLGPRVATGALIVRIADAAGELERRINAIRNREYSTVRLSTADAVCLAVGEQLSLICPPELSSWSGRSATPADGRAKAPTVPPSTVPANPPNPPPAGPTVGAAYGSTPEPAMKDAVDAAAASSETANLGNLGTSSHTPPEDRSNSTTSPMSAGGVTAVRTKLYLKEPEPARRTGSCDVPPKVRI